MKEDFTSTDEPTASEANTPTAMHLPETPAIDPMTDGKAATVLAPGVINAPVPAAAAAAIFIDTANGPVSLEELPMQINGNGARVFGEGLGGSTLTITSNEDIPFTAATGEPMIMGMEGAYPAQAAADDNTE